MVRVATLILAAAILGVAPACAAALEVSQSQWGFDGKVVPGRIAILSVELGNPSAAPFDGVLRLHKETGLGGRVDAPLVEPCFLSPGAARWVQFYPYVRDEHEAWVLEWGLGAKERHLLPGIEVGPPARVVLHDPDDPLASGRGVRFRPFRENLFPPTVAATDGLHSVLLDRVPRWEPVRRQAFLDWLRRGGEVHVLRTPSGRHPVFPDELAVLSSPLERHRVGAGLVLHHAMGRAEASDAALAARGCPPCQLVAPSDYAPSRIGDIEEPLFRALSDMTRPKHAWGFIYLTVVAYIVVLGPLNLLFGRKRRNYRHTLLFFLLTVAGAGVLLYFLGRRGHDEATAVNSLACARQIDADTYDVTQWVNVFVTRGATYRITHDAPHNLYSGCQDREAIRGLIANGKDGVFQVDIPLFSHRPFLHRAKLKGDHIKLDVVRWSVGERLEELVLAAEPGFPQRAAEVWALHNASWYRMEVRNGQLHARPPAASSSPTSLPEGAFDIAPPLWLRRSGYGRYGREDDERPENLFRRFSGALLAREVGGSGLFNREPSRPQPDKDRVQIFIYAPCPQGFDVSEARLGKRLGYVLYCIDVFKPQESAPPGR